MSSGGVKVALRSVNRPLGTMIGGTQQLLRSQTRHLRPVRAVFQGLSSIQGISRTLPVSARIPRRSLATQASSSKEKTSRNNADVSVPVDPEVPFRKTSFNMSTPMLPSHQKVVSPSEDLLNTPGQQPDKWSNDVRRMGVVALKCGMTADWDMWGRRIPLTMLKLENVQVTQVKPPETNQGALTVQVGAGEAKPKRVKKPQQGHFAKVNVEPKKKLVEFKVSPEAVLEPGTEILAQHFVPGQLVDVTGRSTGKGFQGVMKRHNFGGQPATHGVSKAHRSTGSIGQAADPSRVFKGKKMPGRMGGNNNTTQGLCVYKIDIKRNLVYLRGAVPGKAGSYIKVRDSIKHTFDEAPPFPTYFPTEEFIEQLEKWHSGQYMSPSEVERLSELGELSRDYEHEPPFELIMPPPETDPFAIPKQGEPEV